MDEALQVLIVEDRPEDAELMAHELRRDGLTPSWQRVETEADYLRHLDLRPDVILADYSLPGFDAVQALALLRERRLDIPFIIVTGTAREDAAVACMRAGAADYLLKDRLGRLGPAVRSAIDAGRTRRKARLAEEAQRRTERRFQAMVERGWEAVTLVSAEGEAIYRSPAGPRVLGYSADRPLASDPFVDVHPDDVGQLRLELAQMIRSPGQVTTVTVRNRAEDGSWRWIETTGTNLLDDPDVQAIVANHRDVTAQRAAEDALRANEEKFRRIVETSDEGIWTIDAEDRTTYVNPRMAEMLGYSVEEMLGTSRFAFSSEEQRPGLEAHLARRRDGVVDRYDTLLRRRDGTEILVSVGASPIFDPEGRYVGSLGMFSDVTATRQVEEARARLAAIVEFTDDAIFGVDEDGAVTSWNGGATRLFGYLPDEIVGRDAALLVPPGSAMEFRDLFSRLESVGSASVEMTGVSSDGRRIDASLSVSPLRDGAGRRIGAAVIARDIGERKRALEVLEQTNRRLAEALSELEHAQQSLVQQERIRAMGQMASGIAHDVNNHLSLMLGYSELLLKRPEVRADSETLEEALTTIHVACQDAAAVVRGLREFYRPPDAADARVRPVDPGQVVRQVAALTQPRWRDQAQAAGARIELCLETETSAPIFCVESELREILTNLVFNAVDAMPEGGTLTLRTGVDDAMATIAVTDTGVGMTEEVRRRCFEPFFSTKGHRGSGLGLSMAHGIVGRRGGTIEVDSAPGLGTSFLIRLPVGSATPDHARPATATQPPARVLLAEDEPGLRRLTSRMLREEGHLVVTAQNGREALELFRTEPFDLVLTDRAMPEMGGDQLARAVKEIAPGTHVVLLTGFGDLMGSPEEWPPGIDAVLSKPITSLELVSAIGDVRRARDLHQSQNSETA